MQGEGRKREKEKTAGDVMREEKRREGKEREGRKREKEKTAGEVR